jgi:hypothetical protein
LLRIANRGYTTQKLAQFRAQSACAIESSAHCANARRRCSIVHSGGVPMPLEAAREPILRTH